MEGEEGPFSLGPVIVRLKIAVVILCLLLSGPAARADEPLTWEQTIRETEKGNPDLNASLYAARAARVRYHGSHSPLLPQLSASASSEVLNDSREDHEAGLTVRQSLFSGGRNRAGIQQAKAEWEAAEARLAAVKAQVGSELKSAFAQLLFAQEQRKLAETISRRREENVELINLRYEAGREHQGSYLRIKASASQARFETGQASRAQRVAQREMGRVLGRPKFEAVEVAGEFGVQPAGPAPDMDSIAQQTPVYREAESDAESAGADVDIARSRYFPDLDAVATTGLSSSHWPPDENDWSAGIVMTFPFFSGGQEIFDVKAARAEQERALSQLRSVDDKTAAELESRFAALQDAIERVEVRREFLVAADLRAEIARAQYTTGLLSFEDWDLIENDLIDNQKMMLATLRDAVLAEASWERALGKDPFS